MTEPRILCFDLERKPALSYHWDRFRVNIPPKNTVEDERTVSFAARWLGQPKSKAVYLSEWGDGQETMLTTLRDLLDEAEGACGWNSKRFDRRAINKELFLNGINPPSDYIDVDLMVVAKRQFMFTSNSLFNVSREMGIGTKLDPGDLIDLTFRAMAGDEKAQRLHKRYNLQDVHLVHDMYYRFLPWIPQSMHPNVAIGRLGDVCTKCGSENLERRGYKATSTGTYQQYTCRDCGSWMRSSKRSATSELRG